MQDIADNPYCPVHGIARRAEPTPEALEAWAEWFDDPGKSPSIAAWSYTAAMCLTPGYLLREIARRLRAAREE